VKAMILAAGKGERMMPLTQDTPKPLLIAGNKTLIQYQVEALVLAGVDEIIINTGPLGKKIQDSLGDGTKFRVAIQYSHEGDEPCGTGGGVAKALPFLGESPFILVNGDIWTEYDYSMLKLGEGEIAHIVMVDNPDHNPDGDFALHNARVIKQGSPMLTFSGIGIFRPGFFANTEKQMVSYIPALRQMIGQGRVSGEYYGGPWFDIGTPQRLTMIKARLG
jgi:N-acetyl-alpha-D-muramate 1-phosphate uridylyltransferase